MPTATNTPSLFPFLIRTRDHECLALVQAASRRNVNRLMAAGHIETGDLEGQSMPVTQSLHTGPGRVYA